MASSSKPEYRFAKFRLLPGDRRLLRDGIPVPLPPKVFDTLLLLIENRGHLVEKEEFLSRLWPDTFVSEVTLAHTISQLRKALRIDSDRASCIETVARRGYRFISSVEVHADAPTRSEPANVVVAVLPFENLSADSSHDYMANGLTEEVIASLGQIDPEHLSVIGRISVMAYKHTTKSASEIGNELGAGFLVESSMRAEGGRFRVTSKLVRVSDQVQIWSASYDAEPVSMLNFQRDLSTAIAERIRSRLSPARLDALKRRQTQNPEAYNSYLRGRYFWNHFTSNTTRQAIECYVRATQLDPQYALAWSGLADAYSSAAWHADANPADVTEKARTATRNAIDAEPELAETQTSLGFQKLWVDWDLPAAAVAFRHAIRLDPSYSLAYRMLGITLGHMGRHENEATLAMHRARSLDPLDAMHHALSAQVAFVIRDNSAAIQIAHQSTVIRTDFWIGHYQLAQAHEQRGEYDLALEALIKAGDFGGGNSKVLSLRGYVLAKQGREKDASAVIKTLYALSQERYLPPYAIALVYAGLGEAKAVFTWLDRALELHDVHLVLLSTDPKWDAFRDDPRFISVLKRAGIKYRAEIGEAPESGYLAGASY